MTQNFARAKDCSLLSQNRRPRPKVSIVIPVYNEEEFLPIAVPELCNSLGDKEVSFELILCENGSTDGTIAVADGLAKEFEGVRIISTGTPDYGRAMRAGMLASRAPYTVVFDIDYYSISFLERALGLLDRYDIVVASKLAKGADDRRGAFRRLVTRSFSLVLRGAFGTQVRETHGMKAFKTKRISPIVNQVQLAKDLFDTELIIRAERSGLRIKEIPVLVEEKRPTRSSMLKRIPRTLVGLSLLRYYLWKERLAK